MFLNTKIAPFFLKNSFLIPALRRPIVYRYTPQRGPFDKTSYIENYIPRPSKYHKSRKPCLPQWTDPKVEWPILLPPPTKLQGIALIKSLERVERRKIRRNRQFFVTSVRAGDVIQFKYYLSLSEKKFNILTGLVVGRRKINSLDASIRVLFRFCGSLVEMNLKKYSPYLAAFRVVARGKHVRKGKLYNLAQLGLSDIELQRPILKGGTDTKTGEEEKKKKPKEGQEAKVQKKEEDETPKKEEEKKEEKKEKTKKKKAN